jgi:hypothetical protein
MRPVPQGPPELRRIERGRSLPPHLLNVAINQLTSFFDGEAVGRGLVDVGDVLFAVANTWMNLILGHDEHHLLNANTDRLQFSTNFGRNQGDPVAGLMRIIV